MDRHYLRDTLPPIYRGPMAGGYKVETALIEKRVFGGPKTAQRDAKNGPGLPPSEMDGGSEPPLSLKLPPLGMCQFSEHQLREADFTRRRHQRGRLPPTAMLPAPVLSDFQF